MELTRANYHSTEMNRKYMGCTQFKSFIPRFRGCEAKAMAKLTGEYLEQDNDAFLLGNYVHAWNSGELQEFMMDNPSLFKKDGTLYTKYAIGDLMIETLRNDPLIAKVREGQKEVIMTGELFGMPWKIMIDIYNPKLKVFTDLKTCREIHRTYWNEYLGERQNFIEFWGYDWQMAIYAEIERQNRGGENYFSPHIIAVSKEDPPDKEVIYFGTDFIEQTLKEMEYYAERVKEVWEGKSKPERCGVCDYCRKTKVLSGTVFYKDVGKVG